MFVCLFRKDKERGIEYSAIKCYTIITLSSYASTSSLWTKRQGMLTKLTLIAHVQYMKIQLETIDITTRLWGYDTRIDMVYTIKPRSDVCCFKLNFNISNVSYRFALTED